jgi:hypothetical protein
MIHRELAPNADNALTVDEPLSDLLDMVLASCIMIISRRESKRFSLYSRLCVESYSDGDRGVRSVFHCPGPLRGRCGLQ